MAWDDLVVWVLIIAVVVFLFVANKIPEIAKGLGQARKEFEQASKGLTNPANAGNPQTNQFLASGNSASTARQEKGPASV
ncbi:MAG: twin-arginine translocase TatA/TatE family subunit [Nitrososphaerota archaeon]|nr:twin-arginine translocase TatA/TatE family subunit [Nitrososphaerota archaeon]